MGWEYKFGISIVVLAIILNFCDFSKIKKVILIVNGRICQVD